MRTITRRHKGMTALQAAILTGISIAVALIVGYWIWTVVVGSIRTERLTMTIPTASYDEDFNRFNVTLTLKNVGPSDTTIVDVRVNGKPYSEWADGTNSLAEFDGEEFGTFSSGKSLAAGGEAKVVVVLNGDNYKHGQTIEIAFVTSANQVYTSSVALP